MIEPVETTENIEKIERAEDGSYYRTNTVAMYYQDDTGKQLTFYANADSLYSLIHDFILRISQTSPPKQEGVSEEIYQWQKRITAVSRAAVKGVLIIWGDKILTIALGTKHHAKPGKKDDIVDWYMDMFTRLSIAHMMKNDMILTGHTLDEQDNESIYKVVGVTTRPVAPEESEAARDTSE